MSTVQANLFIVGAPKAGTTSLHKFLDEHPQVCMSAVKEPNYFSGPELQEQNLYYKTPFIESLDAYQSLYNCSPEAKVIGEASVSYLYYPSVAGRIHDYNPEAKIIISLREPVARAISHYLMDYSLGLVQHDLETIFHRGANEKDLQNYYQQHILLGNYASQVEKYLSVFPKKQVLILFHEELLKNPIKEIQKIYTFLNIIVPGTPGEMAKENVTGMPANRILKYLYQQQSLRRLIRGLLPVSQLNKLKSGLLSKSSLPQPSAQLKKEMASYYLKDIEKLENLLHHDLREWKEKKY